MNSKKTILVVDDDSKVRLLLKRSLEADGHAVLEAENASSVHEALQNNNCDLITLDLQLGSESGLTIAASVREKTDIPIIMVTGKGDVIDKVVGLELGADDYITKPFHVREMQARVRAALRRGEIRQSGATQQSPDSEDHQNNMTYEFEGWRANAGKFELRTPGNELCELTTTDFKLLLIFLDAPKRVMSRDQIMDELSGTSWTPYDRTVDNQIARLRKKIEPDAGSPTIIKTVRGIGYIFAADVTKS